MKVKKLDTVIIGRGLSGLKVGLTLCQRGQYRWSM